MTDVAVVKVAARCAHLQAVDVGRCGLLTCASVAAILRSCSRLQLLRVGCVREPCVTSGGKATRQCLI